MILDPILSTARRSALASIGAVALARDTFSEAVDQLARRGEQTRRGAQKRFQAVERQVRVEVHHGEERAEDIRDQVLTLLHVPSQSDIQRLYAQVEHLCVEIDALYGARQRAQSVVIDEPLPGYSKLNAESIIERIPELNTQTLLTLRAYEQAHGRRVTVLRAAERTLVQREDTSDILAQELTTVEPLPSYDRLEESALIERLAHLSEAELLHVRAYEQTHTTRTTILDAITVRLEQR
jgi:polyhydroxyalkanoate synthesis regulator phasin